MAGLEGLAELTARLRAMVAAGELMQDAADGVLAAWLDRNAPEEVGEVTAKRIRQMERERRLLVQGMVEEVGAHGAGMLERAREGLLAVSDEEWAEAGGSLDE